MEAPTRIFLFLSFQHIVKARTCSHPHRISAVRETHSPQNTHYALYTIRHDTRTSANNFLHTHTHTQRANRKRCISPIETFVNNDLVHTTPLYTFNNFTRTCMPANESYYIYSFHSFYISFLFRRPSNKTFC